MIQNIVIYSITGLIVVIAFIKDKKKSKKALLKAWNAFESILPQFLTIILLVGIILAFLDTNTISKWLGSSSGWIGLLISVVVGAVTLIPGFIAFPMAAILVANGAGYMQIGAFISSLMMVGIVTASVEKRFFGIKATVVRNILAFLFSIIVGLILGKVFGEI